MAEQQDRLNPDSVGNLLPVIEESTIFHEVFIDAIEEEVWAKLNSLTKKVKSIELKKAVMTLGRAFDNDIQIKDQRLSGKHCKIMRKTDKDGKMVVVIEDSSSNGTYLNG
jgi:hypothetical protein